MGDDAVTAEIIAAFHNGYVGLGPASEIPLRTHRRGGLEINICGYDLLPVRNQSL